MLRSFTQHKEQKRIRAKECQESFDIIAQNSKQIGMLVNERKTQLVCITAAIHSDVTSYINTNDGGTIESQSSLTILGFRFGERPNLNQHMELVQSKVNMRTWIIRHLKQSGVPDKDIVAVYTSTIRAAIEYTSPIYHSLLTKTQEEEIEKLQRRCLKIIYGLKVSYADAMERAGLKTMKERRVEAFKKFATKTSKNLDFQHWPYQLRNVLEYVEENAHTDRLYRSPLFAMRRFLNENN